MTPRCTFLLGALLAVVASAQFPRLPKIDTRQIAGVVKNAEKEVQKSIAQTNDQDLASKVAKNAKDLHSQASTVAQSASQAAKQIAGDAKTLQQAGAIGDQAALGTIAPTPDVPEPVQQHGHHDIVHTDKLLEAVQDKINATDVQEVLKAADNALDPKNIQKAKDNLQDAQDILKANKGQVEDLASKILPGLNPSKVVGKVTKAVNGATKHVEAVKPLVHEVLKSDPKNVAHAAEKGVHEVGKVDPNSVKKYINGDVSEDNQQVAVEQVGSPWQWPLLLIVGALAAILIGWQVMKRRDSRSPTLLDNNDMAGWMGGGPSRSTGRQMQSEEPLFRQF